MLRSRFRPPVLTPSHTPRLCEHTRDCVEKAEYLHEQLRRIGYFSVWHPGTAVVALIRPDESTCIRYGVEYDEQWARFVVAPDTFRFDLDAFVKELMEEEVGTTATDWSLFLSDVDLENAVWSNRAPCNLSA